MCDDDEQPYSRPYVTEPVDTLPLSYHVKVHNFHRCCTLCFVRQWKFPCMWGDVLSLTTQSGSSGTTSQNDRACGVRGVGRGVTAAARARRFPRALLHHSVVSRHEVCTRASFLPRNTRVIFRWVYRVLACSQMKNATGHNESAGGDGQETTGRGDEGQQRARRRRSGKSASFVREARVAGR